MLFDTKFLLSCYERMHLIRFFEEKLAELFSTGLLGGTSHFCIGQEACAVGILESSRFDDWIVSNHRGHGHLLARGLDPKHVMAELLGRSDGYCGGKGGSQHLSAVEKYFLGTNGITGGGIPIGTGAAFALKYNEQDNIAVTFFGDGASNQGTFHESLNMAALWKLPVLYVCENNFYGMSMPIERSCSGGNISQRAAAYCIPAAIADGMDLTAVLKAGKIAFDYVRSGQGPYLLELQTYRFCGHSKNDPRVYRSRDEESAMKEKDCLENCKKTLMGLGVKEALILQKEEAARLCIEEAAEFALNSPIPDKSAALGAVYA